MTGDEDATGALLALIPGDDSTELQDVTSAIQPLNKSVIILEMFHGSHAKENQARDACKKYLMDLEYISEDVIHQAEAITFSIEHIRFEMGNRGNIPQHEMESIRMLLTRIYMQAELLKSRIRDNTQFLFS